MSGGGALTEGDVRGMTVSLLRAALESRGLPTGGKKKALSQRLLAAVAAEQRELTPVPQVAASANRAESTPDTALSAGSASETGMAPAAHKEVKEPDPVVVAKVVTVREEQVVQQEVEQGRRRMLFRRLRLPTRPGAMLRHLLRRRRRQ